MLRIMGQLISKHYTEWRDTIGSRAIVFSLVKGKKHYS